MRSMTGYGRGEGESVHWTITIEVKAVNHRYSEVTIKQPRQLLSVEDKMKKIVAQYIERGKVDVFVRLQRQHSDAQDVQINKAQLQKYHEQLAIIGSETTGLKYEPDLFQLVRLPEVIVQTEEDIDMDELWPMTEAALHQAMQHHVEMRDREGAHICQDMKQKLSGLQGLATEVEKRSPEVLVLYQTKLRERITELLGDVAISEERLAQEVAYFAEKSCIDEELVRLQSHFAQFLQIVEQEGSIGRRLDFLIQEMNRETNTIGSKANDLEIGRLVVEMKSELEKLREQVQNIE